MTPTPEHVFDVNGVSYTESADSARHLVEHLGARFSHLYWPAHAGPGGYPLAYVTADGGHLCPHCANDNLNLTIQPDDSQWLIEHAYINWEDRHLHCDHCGEPIAPAYGADL